MKLNQLSILLAICICLSSTACGQSNQTNSNQTISNQTQTSEIPSGVKNSTYDEDVNRETPLVIKVAADNKTYIRKSGMGEFKDGKIINHFNYILLTDANLGDEIWRALRSKAPDYRVAYIQADTSVKFGKLTELFEKMASGEAELDKIRLIVNPLKEVEKSEQTDSGGYVLPLILTPKAGFVDKNQKSGGVGSGNGSGRGNEMGYKKSAEQIAAEEKAKQIELEKATARKKIKVEKLSVELDDAGKIKFNSKPQTPDEFAANLKKIFDERTAYDIFIDGSNEVNKIVYLKISPDVNYGAAIKLIDEIYGLGTNRLYLDGLQF